MPTPYSTEDLEQAFDTPLIRRGRSLNFIDAVQVNLKGDVISGIVDDKGTERRVTIEPTLYHKKISFAERECTCGEWKCAHMTATALAAMQRFPVLQKPKPAPETIMPAYDPHQPRVQAPPKIRPQGRRAKPAVIVPELTVPEVDGVVLERPVVPVLNLRRVYAPDDLGRQRLIDVLTLDFDYGGVRVDGADDTAVHPRQGRRWRGLHPPRSGRRDADALEILRPDNFVQMRVNDGKSARGQRVLVFRGQEAAAQWHHFVAVRVPVLQSFGWQTNIDENFGPRMVEAVGALDVQVAGWRKGLPSRSNSGSRSMVSAIPCCRSSNILLARGGIDAAQIVGDDLITSLDDGRVLKAPRRAHQAPARGHGRSDRSRRPHRR